ncbi:hypothetical protein, partial [Streptomyces sp. NPDC058401]|uniref:hypothetical protein n=1 Tax=Streptomyces sp. NPDC058401 TaxID=3346480 RepID=UPI00364C10DF
MPRRGKWPAGGALALLALVLAAGMAGPAGAAAAPAAGERVSAAGRAGGGDRCRDAQLRDRPPVDKTHCKRGPT